MIILGTILLVLAVLITLGTVFTNGTDAPDLSVLGLSLSNVSVGGLFLAGVIIGVAGMLGLSLLLGGGARKRNKRVKQKREVSAVRGEAETLEQENARLRDELASRGRPGHRRRGRRARAALTCRSAQRRSSTHRRRWAPTSSRTRAAAALRARPSSLSRVRAALLAKASGPASVPAPAR